MTKTMRGRVLAAALLLMPVTPAFAQQTAPPAYGQPPQPFVWWKSEPFRKELGITTEQAARIDKVWETTRPELRQEWDELSRLEAKLSRMIQADMDEAALSRQIDRVETARANTNKTRSLMLVQMRKALRPDQRTKLDAMHARWEEEQKKLQPPTAHDAPKPHED